MLHHPFALHRSAACLKEVIFIDLILKMIALNIDTRNNRVVPWIEKVYVVLFTSFQFA